MIQSKLYTSNDVNKVNSTHQPEVHLEDSKSKRLKNKAPQFPVQVNRISLELVHGQEWVGFSEI